MSWLGKIYRRNVYGVMGTLVFHILLVSVFILAEMDMKGVVREEELLIEFPDILPEIEEVEEQQTQENESVQDGQDNVVERNTRTNYASNRLAANNNDFFDKEYQQELEAAQKLVSDVNKQLQKEAVDIEDIEMPVETSEGIEPDSVKNKFYAGESNIVYYLENRYHLRLPVPVYLAQGGGTIIVDITVNRNGNVVNAEPRNNPAVKDEQIYLYAKVAASRTVFNNDPDAPQAQKGTIHYTFVPQ